MSGNSCLSRKFKRYYWKNSKTFNKAHEMSRNSIRVLFCPYYISQWNVLDPNIRNLPTIYSFISALFNLIDPKCHLFAKLKHHQVVIFLTRLRIGFSHLREQKFRNNFLDTTDPFFTCITNSFETTEHYLLRWSNVST